MLEEHIAEHAVLRELLSGTRRGRRADRRVAEERDAHMSAEERTFLSAMS